MEVFLRLVTEIASGQGMTFALLDTVVLQRDVPEFGLHTGDSGAVVECYGSDAIEVEFVKTSGQTQALVTLNPSDVQSVSGEGLVSVRRATKGAA